jgi:predicted XRE-type DNA-binding protein
MKKIKAIRTRSAKELARYLDLDPHEAVEIEFRAKINEKIIQVVEIEGYTHEQVARLASTSRTRITAIMNHNTSDISSDLMLRVLAALGYTTKVSFAKAS